MFALLDGGRRTTGATDKLAVLLALVDCCSLGAVHADVVHLRDLAGRVVELYWPMVRPGSLAGGV